MDKLPALLSFVTSWKTSFLGFAAIVAIIARCVSENRLPTGDEITLLLTALGVTAAKDFNVGTK